MSRQNKKGSSRRRQEAETADEFKNAQGVETWLRGESEPLRVLHHDEEVGVVDLGTSAPIVGEVLDRFASRLVADNLFRLPTISADAGWTSHRWLAAASIAGLAHLHGGTSGQDSYSFAASEVIVASVADGLGSRPATAQLGAVFATRALCNRLAAIEPPCESIEKGSAFHDAIHDVNESLRTVCSVSMPWLEDRDLSCTIAFLWIPPPPHTSAVVGRVGDCAAFTLSEGKFTSLFPREEGPINVVSSALPANEASASLELSTFDVREADVALIVTDGLAEDLYSSPSVREWLADSWATPPTAARMIDSLRYRRRGSHDDRTVLATWLSKSEERPETANE